MNITDKHTVLVIDGPKESVRAIKIPAYVSYVPMAQTNYDHVILFRIYKKDLDNDFSKFKNLIKENGKLWIAWPKAKKLSTDLNIKEVIKIGYNHGLVESTNLRIDDTWTALKFTTPKPGKIYKNSYGTLPGQ